MVCEYGPVNYSGIGRGDGWVMGWLCGFQFGSLIHGNFWLKIIDDRFFGEKGSRGLGGFQVVINGINVVFVIEN